MRTSHAVRVAALLIFLAFGLAASVDTAPLARADDPKAHADYGPPKPFPEEWAGERVGVDDKGNWCLIEEADNCTLSGGEHTGTVEPGSDGTESSAKERQRYELEKLKEWRNETDHKAENYEDLNAFVTKCVNDGGTFSDCLNRGEYKHPPPTEGPGDWVAGKVSQLTSDALKEAAGHIGASVVWLLEQFADVFNEVSSITLSDTGLGKATGIATAISVMLATFLLLVQFGKVAVSQQGGPLVTALTGLAKWAVILSVYALATQTALTWSDELSTWIINYTFEGGGSGKDDAAEAMREQLGTLFSGLAAGGGGGAAAAGALATGGGFLANAVGVVIVVGILCILAIGALWVEMLLRQAGIMVLVAVMPIVLAGQLADSTREWWPKARNALIALILMKPVIVLCFAIGFNAMAEGEGIRNVIVGLVIFLLACFAWPVIARFMTFTSNGDGNSAASGLIGTLGASMSSVFGGAQPVPGGAGMVAGGSGFTRALEEDNATTTGSGSNARAGGGFWPQVGRGIGFGLQAAAAGKDLLEGAGANTAAHAGLGPPGHTGGHVVVPPRDRDGAAGDDAGGQAASGEAPPPSPQVTVDRESAEQPPPQAIAGRVLPPTQPAGSNQGAPSLGLPPGEGN